MHLISDLYDAPDPGPGEFRILCTEVRDDDYSPPISFSLRGFRVINCLLVSNAAGVLCM